MKVDRISLLNLSVSPQELLKIPLFMHMSRSGIYYKYHGIKQHVNRAKHLPLRVLDIALFLEEPAERVGEWLGHAGDRKLVG